MNKKNFFDLASSRHSARAFKERSSSEDKIKGIVDVPMKGSSVRNLRSYQIFIVSSIADKLVESSHGQVCVEETSQVLIFCVCPKRGFAGYGSPEKLFCIQDAAIACAYSQIFSHGLGLSSAREESFDEEKIFNYLNLKKVLKLIEILLIIIQMKLSKLHKEQLKGLFINYK